MRVAIIGLYNSGSSVLSQIVEHLGFEIGHPLWQSHFESRSLRAQLVDWWDEPHLRQQVAKQDRIPFLKWWVEHHEAKNPKVCAKHPLLCLSAYDLVEAWGPDLKLIRAARPLKESIAGLKKRRWFRGKEKDMQTRLYDAIEPFFLKHDHHAVEYNELLSKPVETVQALVEYLGIPLPQDQIEEAASAVRR